MDQYCPDVITWLEKLDLLPIAESRALQRLLGISFLGALGPGPQNAADTRFAHSLGVAGLTVRMALQCGLSQIMTRHLVAAALLHDAAHRAMAHTCEETFNRLGHTDGRRITSAIVTGLPRNHAGSDLRLDDLLRQLRLDPNLINALLKRSRFKPDSEAALAVKLLNGPINPDTLDGIPRAGFLFGLEVPDPLLLISQYERRGNEIAVSASSLPSLDQFWLFKRQVYDNYIHASTAISREIYVARRAFYAFRGFTRLALLHLVDDRVREVLLHTCADPDIDDLEDEQIDLFRTVSPLRFREPRMYVVSNGIMNEDWLSLDDLRSRYLSIPSSIHRTRQQMNEAQFR